MKKKRIILIAALAVIVLIIFILSYGKIKSSAQEITREYIEKYKPDIKIKSASIEEITFTYISLNALLEIKNNLPFELPLEKIEIKLKNNYDNVFANANSSNNEQSLKIPADSSINFNMRCDANYLDLLETAVDALKNQTLKCNAEIILTFSVHGMNFNFSYNEEIVFM